MIELVKQKWRDVVTASAIRGHSGIMNGTASNRNCVTKDPVMSVTDALIILE